MKENGIWLPTARHFWVIKLPYAAPLAALLLVEWVLLYKKDLHLFIASAAEPLPVYYSDMLAAIQQRRPERTKSACPFPALPPPAGLLCAL